MSGKKHKKHEGKKETAVDKAAVSAQGLPDGPRVFFLVVTAFVAGASIMIVELAGNRILAPWFGNSLYTWTGLIGVILVSISAGYYFGGYLADKRPTYLVLAHLLAGSALLTLLIPVLRPLIERSVSRVDIVSGPVLATGLLFALPGCLLGSVSPFTIRLMSLLSRDEKVGSSAGYVSMCSTLGSVIGTFCSGFILIPHLKLRMIFLVTGAALAVLAALGYILFAATISQKRWFVILLAAIAGWAIAVTCLTGRKLPPSVVFDQTTFYHRIRVTEQQEGSDVLRHLRLDTTLEGGQYVKSREIPLRYQRYWELSKVFCPGLQRAAFIGGGAFAMPEAVLDAFPKAEVDVIEIDPMVIEVGRTYFRVGEYPRLHAVAEDARRFLRMTDRKYDFIFGDAYSGIHYVPAHLVTLEFFRTVKDRLKDNGVFMMNLISAPAGEHSELFASVFKTLSGAFEFVYVFPLYPERPNDTQNIILVGAAHDLKIESLKERHAEFGLQIAGLLGNYLRPDQCDTSKGMVLTDDRNPVEYMVAQALRAEVMSQ